jgi:D-proline reductase (dithiol) PrdB
MNQPQADAAIQAERHAGTDGDGDVTIPYMQRTRGWYLALGYPQPYRWSHYGDVPFQPVTKPLSAARLTLITTAAPYQPGRGNQGPGAAYNAAAKFFTVYSGDTQHYHDVRIAHVNIDRKQTSMEDSGCWFPLPLLREQVRCGRIGSLARRFHGAPTNRSQRHTIEVDCPDILARCQEDGTDVAVLVPNCPVCHQTLSLVARHREAHGIATVLMACAKDIVEHVGVPRVLFSDFPLGNGAGKPHDATSQAQTLELALRVLESAPAARTTVQSPQRWSSDWQCKLDYCNAARTSAEALAGWREEALHAASIARSIKGA